MVKSVESFTPFENEVSCALDSSVHDEELAMCYEIPLSCGEDREKAILQFRERVWDQQRRLENSFPVKIFSNDLHSESPQIIPRTGFEQRLLDSLLHLFTLGLFDGGLGIAGCNPVEKKNPESGPVEKSERTEKLPKVSVEMLEGGVRKRVWTDLEGNPALGRVIFFRNLHHVEGSKSKTKDGHQKLRVQIGILKELERRGIQHLFSEGEHFESKEGLTAEQFASLSKGGSATLQKMKILFKDPFPSNPEDLTDWQKGYLIVAGARYIFLARHDQARIHPTSTPEGYDRTERELAPLIQEIDEGKFYSFKDPRWVKVQESREDLAVQEIKKFLEKNPGQTVALVYGAAHNFHDNFQRANFKPVVESVLFDQPGVWEEDLPSLLNSPQ